MLQIIMCCKRVCYAILLLTVIATDIFGQPKCKVEFYSTEQGLSHQAVTDIIKDHEGFMWFGSWDGINRFDGHHFISFKSSPGDKSQLGSDRVDQVVEDQADHLWIQAYDKQIYRFDKKNEQFLSISNIIDSTNSHKIEFSKILSAEDGSVWLQSKKDGIFCVPQHIFKQGVYTRFSKDQSLDFQLPANTINIFHKDDHHNIWIGTPAGLCRLVPTKNGSYKSVTFFEKSIAGENITTVDEDANCLYFGTVSGKLLTVEKKSGRLSNKKISLGAINAICRSKRAAIVYAATSVGEIIVNDLKQDIYTSFRTKEGEELLSIYEDRSGTLWMEPNKYGVVRFLPTSQSFRYFPSPIDNNLYKFIGDRFRIFEDVNGTVWINLKGGGFGYFDLSKDSIEYLLNTVDEGNYHLPAVVFNAYYDPSGILWLRTNGRELVKIIFQSNDFQQQPLADPKMNMLGNEARGIAVDNKGRLWVGAKGGDLYVYQDKKRVTGLFENEPIGGFGAIYAILQDSKGNIWMGTKGNGLFKASPLNSGATKYKLQHFRQNKNDPFSLNGDEIYTLLEDKLGRIWVGSFDEGLNLVTKIADSTQFIHTGNAFKNYPSNGFKKIRHLTLDHNGNIWIATTDGLLLLDANDAHSSIYHYASYRKIANDAHSLANNNIQFIFCDSKQRMWLATSGGGFCQAIGNQPLQALEFKNYTTKNGMPNDYILSCEEDTQGNIWIASENGLSKFNPENASFRNYDSYDGLSKVGFSEAAACRGLDGQLFFGTTNGYLSFDPNTINAKRIAANISFTQLQINNNDVVPGLEDGILKTNINYADKLLLKYDQNIVSIDYAILDYRSAGGQTFAYRLSGFDSVWHDDRSQRRVTYTNLPPGDYIFEVKSLSTDLYSNQPYKQLAITIFPPPWKTWWAYLLYGLFIILVLYFIRHYEIVMMRLRNKIVVEQKLATLKMKFFTNVSHELRTPLTLIINPLEKLAKKEKLSAEDAGYVEVARKNANRMVRFINQLLDLRKVQSEKAVLHVSRINVVAFVKEVSAYFLEEAKNKQIKLEIFEPTEDFLAFVDTEKLDVVIYNLLSNALKFTPTNKTIKIIVQQLFHDNSFSITVHDQGPGVPKNKLEDIFELFHEEEQLKGQIVKGSGIGLTLSREFVNLHGGKIFAENNEDGGLSVQIKLKLGKDHYKEKHIVFADAQKDILPVFEASSFQPSLIKPTETVKQNEEAALVLLVEDNDELRQFIGSQLGEFYRVETAKDGAEGLQKATLLLPDLIVSDIMMPNLTGIEMLDRIKNDITTSHIPVVLLSAKYSIESQIEGLKYGADYYITKPFNNEFLIASIDNLLKQRKKLFETLVEKKKTIALSPSDIVVTSKDEAFLKEVVQFVEDKMADTEFSIEAVAEAMAMTHKTFYKKFKSLTGVLPVEFVRDMRLQRAKQLLDSGQYNISEVAYTVGFSNPKYFSTCFKEKFNLSPSDYLKEKPQPGGLPTMTNVSF